MAAAGVASSIFEFLADPVRTSLKLPNLTVAQRKSTKKLIQQHPEIRCESYGFGEDRQLYLFKTDVAQGAQDPPTDQSALTHASLAKMTTGSSTPDCSTATPSDTSSDHAAELPLSVMQEPMQVRNTFIHFEDNEYVDNRIVQSMPRNMFRQCMQADRGNEGSCVPEFKEMLEQTACAMEADKYAKELESLTPGALVIVEGLVKLPAFNGNSAIVQGWDHETGRYDILIASSASQGGFQQAKIKRENLRLVLSNPYGCQ